ncbi:MAG: sigma-70 family RNA polymerase sigma factor [Verrucomicrobiae bacterium]|nr:sigma-70 family RNA polymerase sigma factor [Verrucomicrobiae bacterium]
MATSFPLMFEDGGDKPAKRAGSQLPAVVADERKLFVFSQQWTRHQPSIRAYLASFLGNSIAVDDALQEVAVVVWQKGPWEADASAFLGYCLACARRIALAARRKQADPRMELLSPEAAAALADRVAFQEQQQAAPADERVHALRRCLEKIGPEQRELLESRYAGKSKEELRALSKRGGKSMDAIYKTLERLRLLLRACVRRSQHPTA